MWLITTLMWSFMLSGAGLHATVEIWVLTQIKWVNNDASRVRCHTDRPGSLAYNPAQALWLLRVNRRIAHCSQPVRAEVSKSCNNASVPLGERPAFPSQHAAHRRTTALARSQGLES